MGKKFFIKDENDCPTFQRNDVGTRIGHTSVVSDYVQRAVSVAKSRRGYHIILFSALIGMSALGAVSMRTVDLERTFRLAALESTTQVAQTYHKASTFSKIDLENGRFCLSYEGILGAGLFPLTCCVVPTDVRAYADKSKQDLLRVGLNAYSMSSNGRKPYRDMVGTVEKHSGTYEISLDY